MDVFEIIEGFIKKAYYTFYNPTWDVGSDPDEERGLNVKGLEYEASLYGGYKHVDSGERY